MNERYDDGWRDLWIQFFTPLSCSSFHPVTSYPIPS
uniref:Uncharacterized protein n=1 Tax=viral metagenome TaxID=1070528 RepID=A0A6C0D1X7_9ZZZZ